MQFLKIFNQQSISIKDPVKVIKYLISLCISEIYFGYTLVYLSAVDFNIIYKEYNIQMDISLAQGIYQGVMPIGGAIGALSSSFFIHHLSRRKVVFLFNLIAILLCLGTMYQNDSFFLVFRTLQGFTSGVISAVIPMIIKQNSPHQMSSLTGTFANTFIIFGLFFLYFIAFIFGIIFNDFSGQSFWKIIFLLPIAGLIIQYYLLIFVYPYETPKYLALNNRKTQLKELLDEFYTQTSSRTIYQQMINHFGSGHTEQQQIKTNHVYQSKTALIFAIFYAMLCPMMGINVMLSYGNIIASSILPNLKSCMSMIMMLLYLISAVTSIYFVGKHGRKQLTLWGTIILSISVAIIGICYFLSEKYPALSQFVLLITILVYLYVYGCTYAPVMWMWVPQVLQPNQIGNAIMVNWGGASLVMILFPILQANISNPGYIFLFFALYGFCSIPVINKLMIETKNKKQKQIMEQYKTLDIKLWGQVKKQQQIQLISKEKQNNNF